MLIREFVMEDAREVWIAIRGASFLGAVARAASQRLERRFHSREEWLLAALLLSDVSF